MPLIMETEDGRTYGPGQPYGYQGQYQGQRQPGLETANMRSVPQRLRSLPQRPPGQPSSGPHMGYGGGPERGSAPDRMAWPNLWRTREGFGRTPVTPGEGSYMGGRPATGIFSGRNAGRANDTVGAILGGMGRGQGEEFDDISQTGNPSTDYKTLESKIREIELINPGISQEDRDRLLMEWLANERLKLRPTT